MSYVKEKCYAFRFKHREVFFKFRVHSYFWGFGVWSHRNGVEVSFYKAIAYFSIHEIHGGAQ